MSRVTLCLLNECNLNCKYCFSEQYNERMRLDFEKVSFFIKELHKVDKIDEVTITGGEPFMHPQFICFIIFFSKITDKILVLSNGTIVNKEYFKILDEHSISLHISLDSLESDYHDYYRGKKKQTITNVELISTQYQKIRLNINTTLSPGNIEEIPKIVRWSKEVGATNDYSLLVSNNLVEELAWNKALEDDIDRMIALLSEWADNQHERLKVKFYEWILKSKNIQLQDCMYCKKNVVVYASGKVYACFNNKNLYYGNINVDNLHKIIINYQHNNKNILFQDCFSNKCIGTYL